MKVNEIHEIHILAANYLTWFSRLIIDSESIIDSEILKYFVYLLKNYTYFILKSSKSWYIIYVE